MSNTSSTSSLELVLHDRELVKNIRDAKILLVGAGGIGCEVVKTMLLTGFTNFNIVDLDTIDVSNLNRQFLFNSTHVNKSKSEVAAQVAVSRFAHRDIPGKEVNVEAHQGIIQKDSFDLDFFRSHTLVINALDNIAARSYVNGMCLDADVPLIESGSQGYLGQVYPIIKGSSRCYDCQGQKPENKTFASCTIRNTPSLPIHCIVWGKHLFAQLFGEYDADNDVSPDADLKDEEHPQSNESASTSNASNGDSHTNGDAKIKKPEGVRNWAEAHNYDAERIFVKLFKDDIEYLLKMENLWKDRRKPIPLEIDDIKSGIEPTTTTPGPSNGNQSEHDLTDQRLWSLKECLDIFCGSINILKSRLTAEDPFLVWDKDDAPALDFVTAASNLRSQCFAIERKSRFDVKSLAGNIIPAIPSTNSVVGGLITLQAITIIRQLMKLKKDGQQSLPTLRDVSLNPDDRKALFNSVCKEVYIKKIGALKSIITSLNLESPNQECLVCPPVFKAEVQLSFKDTKIAFLAQDIIKTVFDFESPDIYIDAESSQLFSDADFMDVDEEEYREMMFNKTVSDFAKEKKEMRLRVTDEDTLKLILKDVHIDPNENDGKPFKVTIITPREAVSKKVVEEKQEEDEDITEVEQEVEEPKMPRKDAVKRPANDVNSPSKKIRV